MTPRDVSSALVGHWRVLAAFWLIVLLSALISFSQTKRLYQSRAKLLVPLGREVLAKADYVNGRNVMLQQREQQIHNEQQVLENHEVMLTTAHWAISRPTSCWKPFKGVKLRASRLTSCLALCLLSAQGFGQTRQGNVSERAPAKYQGPPPEFFNSNTSGNPPVIAAGDVLSIRFFYAPELNKVVKVREDGKVSLDLFQGVPVAGQTLEDLQKKLVELYSREYTNPEVTVDFESRANNSVFVTGEVQLPGAKELKGNMTVGMVLAMSQVNQKTAGTKSLFLMRKMEDNKYGVYKLDASFPSGTAHVTNLIPGDILFVPRKGIVKAGDFIDHYARQLLPVTPGAGVYFVP